MKSANYMNLEFPSRSANEAFARSAIACFAAQLDPTLDELGDIKTAVSEAVTNCIVHAYPETIGPVILRARLLPDTVLRSFPLFCPKCRRESIINVQNYKVSTLRICETDQTVLQPDA